MLRQKGLQRGDRIAPVGIFGKEAFIAQMPAPPDHHQIDANHAFLDGAGHHVRIQSAFATDELLFLDRAQGHDLIAQHRRHLVALRLRRRLHGRFQTLQHLLFLAFQEQPRLLHVLKIAFIPDQANAGRGAALDLVEQARTGPVVENAVLAGAQPEHFLKQLHAFPHRAGIGERPKIPVLLVGRAAKIPQPRVAVAAQHNVGIGFVVAEQNVVARRQRLDQVVFQQQRLAFGARDGGLDLDDLRHHQPGARRQRGFLEVGGNPLPEIARLADVDHLAARVKHAVHPRKMGQISEEGFGVEQDCCGCWRTRTRTFLRSGVWSGYYNGCNDSCRTGSSPWEVHAPRHGRRKNP